VLEEAERADEQVEEEDLLHALVVELEHEAFLEAA
jgi:hypothetical protein